jgi:hypothetical protein
MARSKATTSSQVQSLKGEREHRPSWRGGVSYSLGEGADKPAEPQDSYLVLCKIFIHSPKRLRLQVLGSVGREGVSSRATLKVLHPALAQ